MDRGPRHRSAAVALAAAIVSVALVTSCAGPPAPPAPTPCAGDQWAIQTANPAPGIVLEPLAGDRVRVENRGDRDAWLIWPGVHVWADWGCVGWMTSSGAGETGPPIELKARASLDFDVERPTDWDPPYRASVWVYETPDYTPSDEVRTAWAELP